jgi:hypothetical protein
MYSRSYIYSDREVAVIEMRKLCENGASREEIHASAQIHKTLLPECLESVGGRIWRAQLDARHSHSREIKLREKSCDFSYGFERKQKIVLPVAPCTSEGCICAC